jgi:hypothetical protein
MSGLQIGAADSRARAEAELSALVRALASAEGVAAPAELSADDAASLFATPIDESPAAVETRFRGLVDAAVAETRAAVAHEWASRVEGVRAAADAAVDALAGAAAAARVGMEADVERDFGRDVGAFDGSPRRVRVPVISTLARGAPRALPTTLAELVSWEEAARDAAVRRAVAASADDGGGSSPTAPPRLPFGSGRGGSPVAPGSDAERALQAAARGPLGGPTPRLAALTTAQAAARALVDATAAAEAQAPELRARLAAASAALARAGASLDAARAVYDLKVAVRRIWAYRGVRALAANVFLRDAVALAPFSAALAARLREAFRALKAGRVPPAQPLEEQVWAAGRVATAGALGKGRGRAASPAKTGAGGAGGATAAGRASSPKPAGGATISSLLHRTAAPAAVDAELDARRAALRSALPGLENASAAAVRLATPSAPPPPSRYRDLLSQANAGAFWNDADADAAGALDGGAARGRGPGGPGGGAPSAYIYGGGGGRAERTSAPRSASPVRDSPPHRARGYNGAKEREDALLAQRVALADSLAAARARAAQTPQPRARPATSSFFDDDDDDAAIAAVAAAARGQSSNRDRPFMLRDSFHAALGSGGGGGGGAFDRDASRIELLASMLAAEAEAASERSRARHASAADAAATAHHAAPHAYAGRDKPIAYRPEPLRVPAARRAPERRGGGSAPPADADARAPGGAPANWPYAQTAPGWATAAATAAGGAGRSPDAAAADAASDPLSRYGFMALDDLAAATKALAGGHPAPDALSARSPSQPRPNRPAGAPPETAYLKNMSPDAAARVTLPPLPQSPDYYAPSARSARLVAGPPPAGLAHAAASGPLHPAPSASATAPAPLAPADGTARIPQRGAPKAPPPHPAPYAHLDSRSP